MTTVAHFRSAVHQISAEPTGFPCSCHQLSFIIGAETQPLVMERPRRRSGELFWTCALITEWILQLGAAAGTDEEGPVWVGGTAESIWNSTGWN